MKRLFVSWLAACFMAATLAPQVAQAQQVITGSSGSSSSSSASSSGGSGSIGGTGSSSSSSSSAPTSSGSGSGTGPITGTTSTSSSGSGNQGSYILLAAILLVLIGVGFAADMHYENTFLTSSKPVSLVFKDDPAYDGDVLHQGGRDIIAGVAYHTAL